MLTLASSGSPPLTWAVQSAPTGLAIDSSTGAITWTPSALQTGTQRVRVSVSNAAGKSEQEATFDVTCEPALKLSVGCGCGVEGGPVLSLALMLLALLRPRRPSAV